MGVYHLNFLTTTLKCRNMRFHEILDCNEINFSNKHIWATSEDPDQHALQGL